MEFEKVIRGILKYLDRELYPNMVYWQEMLTRIAISRIIGDERKLKTSDNKTNTINHLHNEDENEDENEDIRLGKNHKDVFEAIKYNKRINYTQLMDNLGLSKSSIYRILSDLKVLGYIGRNGKARNGEWIIIKKLDKE